MLQNKNNKFINIKHYIESNGIVDIKPESEYLPKIDEVSFCKIFLKLIKQREKFCYENSSYNYKHILERHYDKKYISNGAVIQAAKELNMPFERYDSTSLDAVLKFNSNDLNLVLMDYFIKKSELSINHNEAEKIRNDLWKSQVKTSKVSLDMIVQTYDMFGVNITVKDLFIILKNTDSKINYDFSFVRLVTDSNFGAESLINVSLHKLEKVLKSQKKI